MARKNNTPENNTNEISSEVSKMLNNDFDNDPEANDFEEFDNSESLPDEAEMKAAFEDAAKDAEGTDLEESEETEETENTEETIEIPKAVVISSDIVDVQALIASIYENAEMDDNAKMTGKAMAVGLFLPILSSRNSVIETDELLRTSHFSEAHDDVVSRATQEAGKFPMVDNYLGKLQELMAEVDKVRTQLSAELKSSLGIKPMTDEDRNAEVANAKAKLGIIETNVTVMEQFDATNNNCMKPILDFVASLPKLPEVTAKTAGTTTRIGASSTEGTPRVRLGHRNGGGVDYDNSHYDTFTDLIRKLKTDGWDNVKSNDLINLWLAKAGKSDWTKVPNTAADKSNAIVITLLHPTDANKTAELKVIKRVA